MREQKQFLQGVQTLVIRFILVYMAVPNRLAFWNLTPQQPRSLFHLGIFRSNDILCSKECWGLVGLKLCAFDY